MQFHVSIRLTFYFQNMKVYLFCTESLGTELANAFAVPVPDDR
jgi:hypothetical protein